MEAFLTEMTAVISQFFTWIGTVATTITSTPILIVFFGVGLISAAIGLFQKLLRTV